MRRVDGAFRLPGAPGRELPEADVVLRGRSRLELVGDGRESLVERLVDEEQLSQLVEPPSADEAAAYFESLRSGSDGA